MALFRSNLDAMLDDGSSSSSSAQGATLSSLGVSVTDDEKKFMMMAALASYEAGEYARAETIYGSMEILHPEWAKPTLGRGICLYARGEIDEAEAAYRAALNKQDNYLEAMVYLGELLWHQRRDRDGATQQLFAAKRLNATHPVSLRAQALLTEIQSQPST